MKGVSSKKVMVPSVFFFDKHPGSVLLAKRFPNHSINKNKLALLLNFGMTAG